MQSAIIPLHEIKENIIIRRIEESTSLNFKGTHRHNFYEILHFSYTEEGLTHRRQNQQKKHGFIRA